jgi:hypothetical protein
MTQQHPITPSDELIGEWIDTDEGGPNVISRIATRAAQWGADQELEACCEWMADETPTNYINALRAARRSKPPSLKKQALLAINAIDAGTDKPGDSDTIRRALEALPDSIVVFPSQC